MFFSSPLLCSHTRKSVYFIWLEHHQKMLCTSPHGTRKLVGGLERTGCGLWIQTAWLLPTELHPSTRNCFTWTIQKLWNVGLVFELFTEKCGFLFACLFGVCVFACVWYAHMCVLVHVPIHVPLEARGGHWMSSSIVFHLIFEPNVSH